jgi:hypothetical protein
MPLRCSGLSMNQGRPRPRTKTSNWRNSTITTIITIIITTMLGADMNMMSPASSWCRPGTGTGITITTTIIITASTAATIEVAPDQAMKNRTSRVLFFCGLEHDPEKHALGPRPEGGYRFSEKIMLKQKDGAG